MLAHGTKVDLVPREVRNRFRVQVPVRGLREVVLPWTPPRALLDVGKRDDAEQEEQPALVELVGADRAHVIDGASSRDAAAAPAARELLRGQLNADPEHEAGVALAGAVERGRERE